MSSAKLGVAWQCGPRFSLHFCIDSKVFDTRQDSMLADSIPTNHHFPGAEALFFPTLSWLIFVNGRIRLFYETLCARACAPWTREHAVRNKNMQQWQFSGTDVNNPGIVGRYDQISSNISVVVVIDSTFGTNYIPRCRAICSAFVTVIPLHTGSTCTCMIGNWIAKIAILPHTGSTCSWLVCSTLTYKHWRRLGVSSMKIYTTVLMLYTLTVVSAI